MADESTHTTSEVGKKKAAAASGTPAKAKAKPRRRRRRGRGWVVVVILLVVVLGTIAIVSQSGGDETTRVEVEKVARREIIQTVTATGVVEPETQVVVSPEVSGEIVYLGVEEGDRVQKGQVIVRIDPEQSLAQLDQAKATISGARARAAQAEASLLRAEQDLKRITELHGKKLATDQELETATTQQKIAQAELDAARYSVQQSQASYRQVQESVNKTTIVAPLTGTVTKLNSKEGEKVVGAIQMTGTEIMTIADLSVITAVVDVSETDVVQVSIGDTAEVEVDAIPNEKFPAVVHRIANSPKQSNLGSQEQLTNFEVEVLFLQPDDRFRPGMTATATIRTDINSRAVSVPIQSVTTRRDEDDEEVSDEEASDEEGPTNVRLEKSKKDEGEPQPVVFVVQDGKVVMQEVATGIRDDRYIEISSGLKTGQQVVSGPYKAISKDLEDGDEIRIKKDEEGSDKDSKSK
jgi:HlyD family secretion protein